MGRRHGARLCLAVVLLMMSACGAEPSPPEQKDLILEVDSAVARGLAFLLSQETPGEGWPSRTYGALRDTASLTPLVAKVLLFGGASSPELRAACDRAVALLADFVDENGGIDPGRYGLNYPVYTASLAVLVLSRHPDASYRPARDAWLAYLRTFQLTEDLGWSPDDLAYGGWGYTLRPLRKEDFNPQASSLYDADLSSTLYAVGALRIAGVGADDPAIAKALRFVMNCQNYTESNPDPAIDDGGFYFTPTNDLQNKAGIAGETNGRARYRSYGSMTADGVRALLRCGLRPDHRRVVVGIRWLEQNFDVSTNPGEFDEMREVERDAAYLYYCWSLAHAMRLLSIDEVQTPAGPVRWAEALAVQLLSLQNEDGSWTNRLTMMKEDDPILATSFAVAALSRCAEQLKQRQLLEHETGAGP